MRILLIITSLFIIVSCGEKELMTITKDVKMNGWGTQFTTLEISGLTEEPVKLLSIEAHNKCGIDDLIGKRINAGDEFLVGIFGALTGNQAEIEKEMAELKASGGYDYNISKHLPSVEIDLPRGCQNIKEVIIVTDKGRQAAIFK